MDIGPVVIDVVMVEMSIGLVMKNHERGHHCMVAVECKLLAGG